jgi:hypothetical protein
LAIWRICKEYQELSGNRPCHAKSLNLKVFFLEMAKVEIRVQAETSRRGSLDYRPDVQTLGSCTDH